MWQNQFLMPPRSVLFNYLINQFIIIISFFFFLGVKACQNCNNIYFRVGKKLLFIDFFNYPNSKKILEKASLPESIYPMWQSGSQKYRRMLELFFTFIFSYCQIWLNLPMDDCHFSSIKKKEKKRKNPRILPPIKVGDFGMDWMCRLQSCMGPFCHMFWSMAQMSALRLDENNINTSWRYVLKLGFKKFLGKFW